MFIKKLNILNFRCIENLSLNFTQAINIFHGPNGAGKTSVLEAIYLLSTGKSFRKGRIKNIIRHEASDFTLYAENDKQQSFSMLRNKSGEWKAKINNQNISKHSQITSQFKVISIDPEVYRLIDSGPQSRRSFLDWCVFHVKHEYLTLWKNLYRNIKHLNTLYKSNADTQLISTWENQFIELSESVTQMREECFQSLKPFISKHLEKVLPDLHGVNIEFKRGWSSKAALCEQMKFDRDRNIQYGQTLSGPHKMDIKISLNNHPASQSLSQGQKKTLSILFHIASIEYLTQSQNINPILCFDDMDAELDADRVAYLSEFINNSKAQVFITSVQKEKLQKHFPEAGMFHVKHGGFVN